MWERSQLFLTRAGTVIVAVCVVLWALAYFPRAPANTAPGAGAVATKSTDQASAQLRYSALGRMGHAIEPVLQPLGFDWRVGVGVLASFAAREVFVSTMGVVFNSGDDEGGETLRARMRAASWESGRRSGRPLFTPLTGISLMVFYVLCCQCASTLA